MAHVSNFFHTTNYKRKQSHVEQFRTSIKSGRKRGASSRLRRMSPKRAGPKSKPKASPRKVQDAVLMNLDPEETAIDKMGLNAAFQVEMEHAIEAIVNVEGLGDIMTAAPLDIVRENVYSGSSGFQAAFKKADCEAALRQTNQYQCGANFFCAKLGFHPSRGVPLRRSGIKQLKDFCFKPGAPVGFHQGIITVAVDSEDDDVASKFGHLQELSPEEMRYAAIMACAEEINCGGIDEQRIREWRQYFLTATVLFVVVPKANRFFKSVTLRNQYMADFEAVSRTAFQQMVEIILFKERIERATGSTLNVAKLAEQYCNESTMADCQEKISESLVDMSLSLWRRAMSIPDVLDVVRQSEEKYGTRTVFDSICKMQAILQKSSTPRNISWCFNAIYDLFDHGQLPNGVGTRQLQGDRNTTSLPEVLVQKLEFLDWATKIFLPPTPLTLNEKECIVGVVTNGHRHFRAKCGCSWMDGASVDMTWRACLSPTADKVLDMVEATITTTSATIQIEYIVCAANLEIYISCVLVSAHRAFEGYCMYLLVLYIPYASRIRQVNL